MKINFKKICAVLSLGAIVATSGMALAKTDYPCGVWKHGTTTLFGGGTLYSNYYCPTECTSYASVTNAKGKSASETKCCAEAKASVKAYSFKTDYAGYGCW